MISERTLYNGGLCNKKTSIFMPQAQSQPRLPVQADARSGFIIAVTLWVFLTASVAFLHHLVFGSATTTVGGAGGQIKASFVAWMPHSAIGYLLLTTIAIDVFVDILGSKTDHHYRATRTLGVVALIIVFLFIFDAVSSDPKSVWSVLWSPVSLGVCLPLKYFALRDYKW